MNLQLQDVLKATELQLIHAQRDAAIKSALCEALKRRIEELEKKTDAKTSQTPGS